MFVLTLNIFRAAIGSGAFRVVLVVRAGDVREAGWTPGSGRSPGGGHGNPLQCSCLENPMDRGAWWAAVYGLTKSQTELSNSDGKESACNEGDLGSIPGEGNGYPLQSSCLGNSMDRSMDRGGWRATVHGVTDSVDTTEQLNISISSSRAVGTKESTTKPSGKHCLLFVAVATT